MHHRAALLHAVRFGPSSAATYWICREYSCASSDAERAYAPPVGARHFGQERLNPLQERFSARPTNGASAGPEVGRPSPLWWRIRDM